MMRGTRLTADGVRALAVPALGGLTWLDLSDNPLGSDGIRALAQAPWLGSLTGLDLSHNRIGPEAARALPELRGRARRALTGLFRADNALGEEGMDALAGSEPLLRCQIFTSQPAGP
jgi:hypothetical protein